MEASLSTFLVFGATGRTGQHFVKIPLANGHKVKALVRDITKMKQQHIHLELIQGSIIDDQDIDALLHDVDVVICILGDAQKQQKEPINTLFVQKIIPAMRRQRVKRFLYQAGGFTRPYKEKLPWLTWILKNTVARCAGLLGKHKDNESVIEYLADEAQDIDWIVHRACIIAEGSTKGILQRDRTKFSLATFEDCAAYNYRLLKDDSAIHTCDLSYYSKSF